MRLDWSCKRNERVRIQGYMTGRFAQVPAKTTVGEEVPHLEVRNII